MKPSNTSVPTSTRTVTPPPLTLGSDFSPRTYPVIRDHLITASLQMRCLAACAQMHAQTASCPWIMQQLHDMQHGMQVSNLGMLQTYYKNAYALIRPACPACFVAISPRVNEEVCMRVTFCW